MCRGKVGGAGGGEAMARSSAGLTLQLGLRAQGAGLRAGIKFSAMLFDGLDVQARIVRARAREQEEACIALSTSA